MRLLLPPASPGESSRARADRIAQAENALRQARHCRARLDQIDAATPASVALNFNMPGPGYSGRGVTVKARSAAWSQVLAALRAALEADEAAALKGLGDLGFEIVADEVPEAEEEGR